MVISQKTQTCLPTGREGSKNTKENFDKDLCETPFFIQQSAVSSLQSRVCQITINNHKSTIVNL